MIKRDERRPLPIPVENEPETWTDPTTGEVWSMDDVVMLDYGELGTGD